MSVATQLTNINAALDAMTAEVAAMATNPKPYYVIPPNMAGAGSTISAVEYRKFLSEQINALIEQRQKIEEPWQVNRSLRGGWGRGW
jgi:hypothetical protein